MLDCRSVALHVQAETMPTQINPGLMERLAAANSFDVSLLKRVYRP